jgi:hypothetical protein
MGNILIPADAIVIKELKKKRGICILDQSSKIVCISK